jgi:uncharacterized protein (TIGR02145 family)
MPQLPDVSPTVKVTDMDGNVYQAVKIGNQIWTTENLRTTKYNDGTPISNVTNNNAWVRLTTGGLCWYKNKAANKNKYGALYNWYAVNTDKLTPAGWHVPTDAEWTVLEDYLIAHGYNWDVTKSATNIAKVLASNADWSPSTITGGIGNDLKKNNGSGFSALPGGCRDYAGVFVGQGSCGFWWSATEDDVTRAGLHGLSDDGQYRGRSSGPKSCGFSVRLVRD